MMGSYPQCYREAWHDPRCQEAMYDEFDLLQNKKTWDLVTLPHRRKLVQHKWIYKTKYRIQWNHYQVQGLVSGKGVLTSS